MKDIYVENDINVVIPNKSDQGIIHDIIINKLCKGIIDDNSFEFIKDVIFKLYDQKCEGIILGCTEIPLLINNSKFVASLNSSQLTTNLNDDSWCYVRFFDTTLIHSQASVRLALED